MYPHRIRLRGPWECVAESATRMVKMPCRWADLGLGADARRVRCHRRFGRPRQLDPHERVWLVIARAGAVADVVLNEHTLDRAGGARDDVEFEVTALLDRRNHLQVVAEKPGSDSQVWGDVALEIRCTAFLHGPRVWVETCGDQTLLHAAGVVAGAAPQSLDVYVLVGGRSVGYASVTAGTPFEVVGAAPRPEQLAGGVRIELVCGGVVWHEVECPV